LRHCHFLALGLLFLSTSCSWYRDLERSMVEDDERQQRRTKTVTRDQYDQLLVKYEELSKKYEALKDGKEEVPSLVDELQKTQSQNFARPSVNVETETVNVFETQEPPAIKSQMPKDLEGQLGLYRRGLALKVSNPGEATKIFQQLETSAASPVRARAKLQIGEMLLQKQQYDLALQVFEDIINRHADSGVVLDALRLAVISCDKLGIPNKKDQYASMLNDVFEMN
jgi:TolA-binding protein